MSNSVQDVYSSYNHSNLIPGAETSKWYKSHFIEMCISKSYRCCVNRKTQLEIFQKNQVFQKMIAIVNTQTDSTTGMKLDVTTKLNYHTKISWPDTTSMRAGAIVCVIQVNTSVLVTWDTTREYRLSALIPWLADYLAPQTGARVEREWIVGWWWASSIWLRG